MLGHDGGAGHERIDVDRARRCRGSGGPEPGRRLVETAPRLLERAARPVGALEAIPLGGKRTADIRDQSRGLLPRAALRLARARGGLAFLLVRLGEPRRGVLLTPLDRAGALGLRASLLVQPL